ncbi:pyridoxal phosphate-dependent aminotransferase [Arvimicrobium flavum]|uniref:pyridoxal phosphate-dependent aminotransferase n=1 Tax=Arvimicrobium flavum TaxID=3393320 RepID=UPI00237BCC81|nr:pyridoxal phosphate-dependent aminotransferase [Mesorhizobium shangrilense]
MTFMTHIQPAAARAPASGIVSVVNYGRDRPGLIPLWAGEGDLPTPDFISEAAAKGLRDGETFYTWQRGIPDLREALARYYQRHFGRAFPAEEFIVTSSGMHAIQLAIQLVAGGGDDLVYLSPAWPNFAGAAIVAGANPIPVALHLSGNGWSLDLDLLEASITPKTRAIFLNSPCNPTGWTADLATLKAVLDLARRKGLWIIADEIYSLFHYDGGRAPSFLDIMAPEDRILFVNTFSKNWAMTGWRVGWLRVHPSLQQTLENLIQYSTSGVAQFMQRGAIAALDEGDAFVASQVERAHRARDLVCGIIGATGRARFAVPLGAFYLFFAVDGLENSMDAAIEIVDKANVGLAPGTAFGAGGEGFLRLCFHRRLDQVEEAATRVADRLGSR